jgi:hypothetical protein
MSGVSLISILADRAYRHLFTAQIVRCKEPGLACWQPLGSSVASVFGDKITGDTEQRAPIHLLPRHVRLIAKVAGAVQSSFRRR